MLLLSGSLLGIYGIGVFAPLTFLLVQAFAIPQGSQLVVWDDNCTFCRRLVNAFRRLDVFGGLHFVGSSSPQAYEGTGVTPAAAADAMQFVSADDTVHSGFAAVRRIVHTLPLGFLISPWFALPMVRQLGDRAYAAVAARRDCRLETEAAAVAVIARGSADADNSSRGD
jgi:predicted DCC family thiol-disulfide oxidoreductase YuxK